MIPTIDVRISVARGEYAGTLSFEYDPEAELLDIPYAEFSSPVRAELGYEIFEDGSVSVTGTLRYGLKGACSRCLADAAGEFTGEADGLFVPGNGDGETYGYRNGTVRLEEFLRDSLLFALPSRLLCGNCGDD